MTFMQQIEISSVNEKLKLLVDFNTATKLLKDKDYLRQYVEQLRVAGILKTSSDKESGKTKQDETSVTTKEVSNSKNENGIKKPVESDTLIKQTSSSTVTANGNDALKIANQREANKSCTVKIISEKEQQSTQNSENAELPGRTPTVFIINKINKTEGAINAQETKDPESDTNDDVSSGLEAKSQNASERKLFSAK